MLKLFSMKKIAFVWSRTHISQIAARVGWLTRSDLFPIDSTTLTSKVIDEPKNIKLLMTSKLGWMSQ